ncbi:MAG: sulfite exporter TauE/SafE family protein, partial [Desulfobacterales bacterium]|nr:sulfite exporter TauE/SafE family protein [Desulfobacterales bacterium]
LLLYVPPLFELEPLSMRIVAGLTIIQGLLACVSGALSHLQFHMVSGRLSLYMGISIFMAAMAGSAGSSYVSNEILLFLFACLALSAALLMLLPVRKDSEKPDVERLTFQRWRAVTAASGVGLLGGLVGQGGSFILIPLMTSFVKIPTRIAMGSNLAIVLLSTIAGFIGKAATGQIAWMLAIPIALTVVPATYVGSLVSRRVPVPGLRKALAALIAIAAIRIWGSFLFVYFSLRGAL